MNINPNQCLDLTPEQLSLHFPVDTINLVTEPFTYEWLATYVDYNRKQAIEETMEIVAEDVRSMLEHLWKAVQLLDKCGHRNSHKSATLHLHHLETMQLSDYLKKYNHLRLGELIESTTGN